MGSITDAVVNRLRKFLRIEPAEEREVVIKDPLTHEGNCAKNRIWYRGLPNQLSEFYKAITDSPMFWAAKPTRGLEIRKIHTGLAAIVTDMIVKIICNDFNGIEIDGDAHDIAAKCVQNGLLIITAKDVLRMLPPLIITKEEIDEAVCILKSTLEECHK